MVKPIRVYVIGCFLCTDVAIWECWKSDDSADFESYCDKHFKELSEQGIKFAHVYDLRF